jgi:serine/threonine protein kinase
VWKRLNHPNIVPLRGVTLNPLQLISEWMPGGELREYVKLNRDANPIRLVSPFLPISTKISPPLQLLGIAEGLAYLHSCNVIHGDLKGVCVTSHPGTLLLSELNTAKHCG